MTTHQHTAISVLERHKLDRLLIINQRHLLAVLNEYVKHYNTHRPHQTLDQRAPLTPPPPRPDLPQVTDHGPLRRVERKDVLGGLLHEYHRAA